MSSESSSTQNISPVYVALSWVATILTPVILSLTAMRLIMVPVFLNFEYNTPNFPPDRYGFTKEERLYWSNIALEYLLNSADISFLGDLRFADGTPVYNERELEHMVDVKNTLHKAFIVWYVSIGVVLILGIWAWRSGWWEIYRRGLWRGGWLTVLLVAALILIVLLSFGVFFVAFHNVFFAPGTWVFNYSDTLIRLFPERFWRDIFIIVGSITILCGLALSYGLSPSKKT
jgi:integral membrane protein (TIGR01906 family)